MSTPVGTPRPGLRDALTRGLETPLTDTLIKAAESFGELTKRIETAAKGILNKEDDLKANLTSLIKSLKQAPFHFTGVCYVQDLLKDNGFPKKIISAVEKVEKLIENSQLDELGVILSTIKTVTSQVLREAEKEQRRVEDPKKLELELQKERSTIEESLNDLDDLLSTERLSNKDIENRARNLLESKETTTTRVLINFSKGAE